MIIKAMSCYQAREHHINWILQISLLWLTLASAHKDVASPNRHNGSPDTSTLKIKPRESEASITLGKDLVLEPVLSTKESTVANLSNSNDIAMSTRLDSPVSTVIASRVSSGQYGTAIARRPIPKDTSPRDWSSQDTRHRAGKGTKTAWKRDSYLEALTHSHTSDDPREGVVRTDTKPKTNRREYASGFIYKPEVEYGSSDTAWRGPRISYGGPSASIPGDSYSQPFRPSLDLNISPQNSYGPPPSSSIYPQTPYGPSGNSYLPTQQQAYGTAQVYSSPPAPVYSAPYSLSDVPSFSILPTFDLGWPLALKLNAFTIAKIVLKLVIFKMIVKFIAVICLLLFIPKLEIKKKVSQDEDDEERSWSSPYASVQTLNDVESTVKSSIEKYEAQNEVRSSSSEADKCTTLSCRAAQVLAFRESWDDYLNLFKNYAKEEREEEGRRTAKREKE